MTRSNPFTEEVAFWTAQAEEARETGAPEVHIAHFEAQAEAAREDEREWVATR